VLAKPGDRGDDLGELVGVLEIRWEEAVVAGRATQRLGVARKSRDPHWHAGRCAGRGRNWTPSMV
jgi:hypothetical protein